MGVPPLAVTTGVPPALVVPPALMLPPEANGEPPALVPPAFKFGFVPFPLLLPEQATVPPKIAIEQSPSDVFLNDKSVPPKSVRRR
jgi:hypothetical protein